MSDNRSDWAVQVLTPTTGDDWIVGTGYPIGPDRILTSLHVVRPQDLDTEEPINVRLPEQDQELYEVSDVLWESDAQRDIAIIKAPLGLDQKCCASLARHRPADGEHWKLFGFARVSKSDTEREGVGLSGTLQPSRSAAPLELGVEFEVEEADYYAGISGAAVFVADRIVGVIKSSNPGFQGRRLQATSVSELLADDGFLKAAGFSGKAGLVESVARNAFPRLVGDKKVQAACHLLGAFGLERAPWSSDGALSIIERCTSYSCGELAKLFMNVLRQYGEEGGNLIGLEALYDFALAALPAAVDEAHRSGFHESLEGEPGSFKVGNRPKAEALMAAADGRAMIVRVSEIPEEDIRSGRPFTKLRNLDTEFGISLPADTGFDVGEKVREIQRSLGKRVSDSEEASEEDLNSNLRFVAESYGHRYYILLSGEQNTQIELARELRERFPLLVVLVLSPDPGRDPQEKTDLIRSIYAMRFEIRRKEIFG